MNVKSLLKLCIAISCILASTREINAQPNFQVLHNFVNSIGARTNADGDAPRSGFVQVGTNLYGAGFNGGYYGGGTIFRIGVSGAGFQVLHNFNTLTTNDGCYPYCSLTVYNGLIYGVASQGGLSNSGAIFKMNPDGTGYGLVYSFPSNNIYIIGTNGSIPESPIVIVSNTIYGTTVQGGTGSNGVVYRVNTDGSSFTNLHTFSPYGANYTNLDGADGGEVTVAGNCVYGVTSQGGRNGYGTFFRINTDGTAFTNLHDFARSNGYGPFGNLTNVGSVILGGCAGGGDTNINANYGSGIIYSINTNGTAFTAIHSFSVTDGGGASEMLLSGSTLYGTTTGGGANGTGVIFSMNLSGSGYSVLHSFTPATFVGSYYNNTEGYFTLGSLVLTNNNLYMVNNAGGNQGQGTAFAFSLTSLTGTNLHDFTPRVNGILVDDGAEPEAGVTLVGNTLYGTTASGGMNWGITYSLNTDGTGFQDLGDIDSSIGISPQSVPVVSGGILYATASAGSTYAGGSIFSLSLAASNYSALYTFSDTTYDGQNDTNTDGYSPAAGVILSNGTFYGTTAYGGGFGNGSIYSVNTDGSGFTNLYSFSILDPDSGTNDDGADPACNLLLIGGSLYGTTVNGGTAGAGTIFKIGIDGSGYTVLYTFSGAGDGQYPYAGLITDGSVLYGTTTEGGTGGNGVIFAVNLDGSGFHVLHTLNGSSDGANPYVSLTLSGTTLYGAAANGGTASDGTLFSLTTGGSGFQVVHTFTNGLDGEFPLGTLLLANQVLYGTASYGGAAGYGLVFAYSLVARPSLSYTVGSAQMNLYWPTNASNFSLQSSTNLAVNSWTSISSGISVSGTNFVYNVSTVSGAKFFRLQSN